MKITGFLALGAGLSLAVAPAAQAACFAPATLDAAKLRTLDVMLMVSSLRCRSGAEDFQADYGRFVDANRAELSKANHRILDDFAARMGAVRASAEMDRTSVRIANRYGQEGALGCHQLRLVAADLAATHEVAALEDAAEALVGDEVAEDACEVSVALAPEGAGGR